MKKTHVTLSYLGGGKLQIIMTKDGEIRQPSRLFPALPRENTNGSQIRHDLSQKEIRQLIKRLAEYMQP